MSRSTEGGSFEAEGYRPPGAGPNLDDLRETRQEQSDRLVMPGDRFKQVVPEIPGLAVS